MSYLSLRQIALFNQNFQRREGTRVPQSSRLCETPAREGHKAQGYSYTQRNSKRNSYRECSRWIDQCGIYSVAFTTTFHVLNYGIQVLHFLAIARAADLTLTIDDFQEVAERTPYLCDLKYGSRFFLLDRRLT